MHKMRKSDVQLTGCLLQRFNSWNSTTTSSSCYRKNSYPQIRLTKEDSPQNISWGLQIVSIISIPWPQLRWILSNYSFKPDYQAQESLSCHFSHFACPPSHEGYTSPDTFYSLTFIKERILCKIKSHPVIKGKKYLCRSGLLHFNSPDLNSKHLKNSFPLYLCIPVSESRKNKFSHSLFIRKPNL